jgi:HEAT repeat protein
VSAPPAHDDFDAWVVQLADTVRAQRAYWHLVLSGSQSVPAVRRGLRSPIDDVRRLCTRALDHLVDADSFPILIEMLDDSDARVRIEALHALACDRCKANDCRPDARAVLDRAIRLLLHDTDRHVRAWACELVGRWVHDLDVAASALVNARDNNHAPAVRKKASWYAPGGTIFERTKATSS